MKDIGWKLLSVAIAAIMWFMVINITQPVDSRNYSRPLTLQNLETLTANGLTVGNMEELKNIKVSVKVKAQRTALDRLNQNPEWVQASVDLSELIYAVSGDTVALPVETSMQGGLTGYGIVSKTPTVVEVHVETLASKELPVEVVLTGEVPKNIYLSDPALSSETVLVTGPASVVNQVTSVKATINAEEIQNTPELHAPLAAYNTQGEVVKGVSINISEITIFYALHDMKQIPIQVDITGMPAAGYQVGTVICTPKYAEVVGSAENLEELLYLHLDEIDVSGRTSSVTRTFSLRDYLPEGISLRDGSSDTAQVTIEITAQSSKNILLPQEELTLLGQEDGKTYTLNGDIHLSISGDSAVLESLQSDDISATVNVGGLAEGDHRVLVHLGLPDGLLASPTYVTVTVGGTIQSPENEY